MKEEMLRLFMVYHRLIIGSYIFGGFLISFGFFAMISLINRNTIGFIGYGISEFIFGFICYFVFHTKIKKVEEKLNKITKIIEF